MKNMGMFRKVVDTLTEKNK